MDQKKTRRGPSAAFVLACISLFVSTSGVTYAATGGSFLLGSANSANATTSLTSNVASGGALSVRATGDGPAATFTSKATQAPIAVNNATKVSRLNADLLDGLNSTAFVRDKEMPAASVVNTESESAPAASGKVLNINAEIFDHGDMHSMDSNTTALVAPVTGMYAVNATVDWDANEFGYRRTSLVGPNGQLASVAGRALPTPAYTSQNVSGVEYLQAGQQVQVEVLQGSGGPLNVRLARFSISYIGK